MTGARTRAAGAYTRAAGAWTLLAGALLTGCGREEVPAGTPGGGDPTKGRQVWLAQCVACHNTDPSKDGPVGPAVKGASLELLEARVLRGQYPPGYMPKRDTKAMPPRPDLAPRLADLAAYLR